MRAALPAMLIPPMIFWACGNSASTNDAGNMSAADAGGFADAAPVNDAGVEAEAGVGADTGIEGDAGVDADGGVGPDAGDQPDSGAACAYPANPVEPMALNSVIFPYSWPEAINGAGDNFPLSLEAMHCDSDTNIPWSQFGHILFVSAPAW
jgi:hypothetical protein